MHFLPADATMEDVSMRKHIQHASSRQQFMGPSLERRTKGLAERIVNVLDSFRLITPSAEDPTWKGRERVLVQIQSSIQANCPVHLILPGFPFKSPNKNVKVFGVLPDKAEEVALKHLDGICATIRQIYARGAYLHIVSDGPMYNDLLGVDDDEVWQYGQALHQLAAEKNCAHIKFVPFAELLGVDEKSQWSKNSRWEKFSEHRASLISKFTPDGFNIDTFLKKDKATTSRYCGCIKFLEKDLEFAPWLCGKTKSQKKKAHGATAKAMMLRGECFAAAVAASFGSHIRLSVHASGSEAEKLSVSMLPECGLYETTPWHNILVQEVDGSMSMAHKDSIDMSTHTAVSENGRLSHYRAESPLYHWPDLDVVFEYLYPCGIIIRPVDTSRSFSLQLVHVQKVLALAEQCSPVVLRGFTTRAGELALHSKASRNDEPSQPLVAMARNDRKCSSIRPRGSVDAFTKGLQCAKMQRNTSETLADKGTGRFQLFNGPMQSSSGSHKLFFVSSRLFLQHISLRCAAEELHSLVWMHRKPSSADKQTELLPLVMEHPSNGRTCARIPKSALAGHTILAPRMSLHTGGCKGERCCRDYSAVVDAVINDSRVHTQLELRNGDILVSDRFSASYLTKA